MWWCCSSQGKLSLTPATTLLSLWRHECERVFCDKLTNNKDKDVYAKFMQVSRSALETVSVMVTVWLRMDGLNYKDAALMVAWYVSVLVLWPPPPPQDVLSENFPGEMVASQAREFFMVNFLRDDVYDDDGVLQVRHPVHYPACTCLLLMAPTSLAVLCAAP